MISWFTCILYYTYKWLVRVSAHSRFSVVNLRYPWVLTWHYITTFFVLLSMTVSLSLAPGDHVSNINMVTLWLAQFPGVSRWGRVTPAPGITCTRMRTISGKIGPLCADTLNSMQYKPMLHYKPTRFSSLLVQVLQWMQYKPGGVQQMQVLRDLVLFRISSLQIASPCNTNPCFFVRESQAPIGAYLGHYGTTHYHSAFNDNQSPLLQVLIHVSNIIMVTLWLAQFTGVGCWGSINACAWYRIICTRMRIISRYESRYVQILPYSMQYKPMLHYKLTPSSALTMDLVQAHPRFYRQKCLSTCHCSYITVILATSLSDGIPTCVGLYNILTVPIISPTSELMGIAHG